MQQGTTCKQHLMMAALYPSAAPTDVLMTVLHRCDSSHPTLSGTADIPPQRHLMCAWSDFPAALPQLHRMLHACLLNVGTNGSPANSSIATGQLCMMTITKNVA
jgi:hypothetical protein